MTSPTSSHEGGLSKRNIFAEVPSEIDPKEEFFESLLPFDVCGEKITKIERIVSRGHASPEDFWYDQEENEWVMVVKGTARLQFSDGREVILVPGDHIFLPAHTQHRVSFTSKQEDTVWLAVFFTSSPL